MKNFWVLAILAVVVILLTLFSFNTSKDTPSIELQIGNTSIKALVADSQLERNRGLSGREELKNGEGMLFIFEEPVLAGFWMKDMKFAIDIVWIGEDFRVLGVEKAVEPATYPEVFYPPSEVRYVLEVPAGFSDTADFETGNFLSIGQGIF